MKPYSDTYLSFIDLINWKLDIGTPVSDIINDQEIIVLYKWLDLCDNIEHFIGNLKNKQSKATYDVLRYANNSFISIVVSSPNFKPEIFNIRKSNNFFDSILKFVDAKDYRSALSLFNSDRFTKTVVLSDKIKIQDSSLSYNGVLIEGDLANRIVMLYNKNQDYKSLVKFMEKLQLNPGVSIKDRLFSFLEHTDIKINKNGNFLAYKYVTKDFKDNYTKTIDNSIGTVVKMPRELCDDRDEVTCSRGLHVGAKSYVQSFSNNSRIVLCEINPKDVVSVPVDYNNTKMRVCKYKVLKEVKL